MSENAPGQLLGFTIQYPRALCHLLRAEPGSIVCLEVHGDVSTTFPSASVIAEEDKSSIRSNPLTDKSSDLWKTFSNWVNAVLSGELDPSKTSFILYRNRSGRKGLVEEFSSAVTIEASCRCVELARQKLKTIDKNHSAWKYYKNAVIDNSETLVKIIQKFHLESGVGAGYDEVEQEIVKKHVPSSQIRTLVQSISGWLTRLVSEKISSGFDARISWEDFDKEFIVHFDRARRLELIDFALTSPPSNFAVNQHVNLRPVFLKQLELVNSTDDEIIEAVTHYLRAQINRNHWIEDDLIDEELAADFERKLMIFWTHTQKRLTITNRSLSKEDLGSLLLSECMVRQETIGTQNPPACTIPGTFHALANTAALGWHLDWKDKFKK